MSNLSDLASWQAMSLQEQADFLEWNRLPAQHVDGIRWYSSAAEMLGHTEGTLKQAISTFDSPEGRLTRLRESAIPERQARCQLLQVGDRLTLVRVVDFSHSSHGRNKIEVIPRPEDADGLLGYLGFDVTDELTGLDLSRYVAVVIKLTGNEPGKPLCGVNLRIQLKDVSN